MKGRELADARNRYKMVRLATFKNKVLARSEHRVIKEK